MVVLPEPVGPVTITMPLGLWMSWRMTLQVVLAHAELVEVEADVAAVEHAHDDALAEHRRQHADAEVDRLVVDVQLDAAVLRHAPLGDVEVRHDLDAAS